MSMTGFYNAVIWTGRFLTAYENMFRSSIFNSPHWYLQMITDAVIAIIDRSGKGQFTFCMIIMSTLIYFVISFR